MRRNRDPLVSVIVPAFNAAGTVLRAVSSVLGQTEGDLEVLVVDDGSKDETADLVRGIGDPRVKLQVSAQNWGAAVARNNALATAAGRYITFLDADDLWMPDKLRRQLALFDRTGAAFGHTSFLRRGTGGDRKVCVPLRVTHKQLLRGNVIGCLTAIYDTQKVGKIPMPDIRRRQDFALWLRILKLTDYAVGLDEVLAVHYRSHRSLSSGAIKSARASYHVLRHLEKLSPFDAANCLAAHYLNRMRLITSFPHTPEAPHRCDKS